MKLIPKEFKITRWYVSPTLRQQFKDGTEFTTAEAIHCEPHLSYNTNKDIKIDLLRLEWGYMLKGFIEYIADDFYFLDFTLTQDSVYKLDQTIAASYVKFIKAFDEKKVPRFDATKLPILNGKLVDSTREKIFGLLRK